MVPCGPGAGRTSTGCPSLPGRGHSGRSIPLASPARHSPPDGERGGRGVRTGLGDCASRGSPSRMLLKGFSLLETLVVTLLLFLVVSAGSALFAHFSRVASRVGQRAEGLETVRTIAWILPMELSGGRPGRDWEVHREDSLVLRAFRGLGMVSPNYAGGEGMPVCFRGVRSPNPQKDSVLLLGRDGRWRAHDLVGRAPGAAECRNVERGRMEHWDLAPDPVHGVVARLFERGSYHMADGAFRYRRGQGGRQPLTPERIESGKFAFVWGSGVHLVWDLALRDPVDPGPSPTWGGMAR
jgi:hypothetical protein